MTITRDDLLRLIDEYGEASRSEGADGAFDRNMGFDVPFKEKLVDTCEALLAEREWKPIGTAPTSGAEILLYLDDFDGWGPVVCTGRWNGSGWQTRSKGDYWGTEAVKMWMDLPEPPK